MTSEQRALEIAVAVAADLLACLGATLGLAVQRVIKQRNQAAKKLFVEQVEIGDRILLDVGEIDEVAAMVFRYMRAAQEGSARLNLRLMAMTIKGIAKPTAHLREYISQVCRNYIDTYSGRDCRHSHSPQK